MIKRLFFIFLIAFSGISLAKSFETRSIDAYSLDISGVKLGMSKSEAIKAIVKTLRINKKTIKEYNFMGRHTLTASVNGSEVTVNLVPNIFKKTKSVKVVNQVDYTLIPTAKNRKAMKESALQKYGKISGISTLLMDAFQWCKNPIKVNGRGNSQNPYSCRSHKIDSFLELSDLRLTLRDEKYNRHSIKLQENKKERKPLF